MRLFVSVIFAISAFVAATTSRSNEANAVIYCSAVGVPRGCVVRPVVAAPVVVVTPASPTVVYCKTAGVPKGCVVRR